MQQASSASTGSPCFVLGLRAGEGGVAVTAPVAVQMKRIPTPSTAFCTPWPIRICLQRVSGLTLSLLPRFGLRINCDPLWSHLRGGLFERCCTG